MSRMLYVKSAVLGMCFVSLVCGVSLTLATSWLNRFQSYLDIVVLWGYLQIPLTAVCIVAGAIVGITEMSWDTFRARTSSQRPRHIFAVSLGVCGLAVFFLLALVRGKWWYFDIYPWVDTWREMLWIALVSLMGLLVVGVLVFWAAFKLLPRVLTQPTLHNWRFWLLSLSVFHLGFLLNAGMNGDFSSKSPLTFPPRAESVPRMVILGIDGATFRIMNPLLEKGELPNFQSVIDRGVRGYLQTLSPTNSPILWTSIATGTRRNVHGVMNFLVQHLRGTSVPVRTFPSHMGLNTTSLLQKIYGEEMVETYPVTGAFREAATVWEIAGAYGIRVGVANWWPTWPAPAVNGFVVTDHLDEYVKLKYTQASAEGTSGDSGIGETVPEPITMQALTWPDNLLREIELSVESYGWRSIQDEQWIRLSAELYRRYEPELFFLYLKGPDGVQHLRWDAYEPHLFRGVDPAVARRE